jgi:hypothetical protein
MFSKRSWLWQNSEVVYLSCTVLKGELKVSLELVERKAA